LIDGDRNKSYGTPTQNFSNIAELWNVRFAHLLQDGKKFNASDVADAMILLKVARNIASKKRDGWVDIAGYAGCGYEAMLEEDKERERRIGEEMRSHVEIHVNTPPDANAKNIADAVADATSRRRRY
jgi:hypothetical protein